MTLEGFTGNFPEICVDIPHLLGLLAEAVPAQRVDEDAVYDGAFQPALEGVQAVDRCKHPTVVVADGAARLAVRAGVRVREGARSARVCVCASPEQEVPVSAADVVLLPRPLLKDCNGKEQKSVQEEGAQVAVLGAAMGGDVRGGLYGVQDVGRSAVVVVPVGTGVGVVGGDGPPSWSGARAWAGVGPSSVMCLCMCVFVS